MEAKMMEKLFDEPTTVEKVIGRNIREKRMKRGFTLTDVAMKLKCSYQQVQKYESAKTRITAAMLHKFANLYGVGIDKFFEGVDEVDDERIGVGSTINGVKGNDDVINVMVVEDNPGDETIIRSALESFQGMNVFCAHDGAQTMEILRYRTLCQGFPRPDLILLDVYLPKRDGISVLRELKRDSTLRSVPVVVVSNSVSIDVMSAAYESGAAGYICKALEYDAFRDSVVQCIKYWTESVVLPSTIRRCLERSAAANLGLSSEQLCQQRTNTDPKKEANDVACL
jgi:CheY-like chemotaxis protein